MKFHSISRVDLLQFALQRPGLIFTSLNSLTIKFPTALLVTDKLHFDLISIKSTNSSFFFFNNVIYFIQMLATINTPKVPAPFGVSLLHLVLIIQGYNQNYMKYIYNLNTISI